MALRRYHLDLHLQRLYTSGSQRPPVIKIVLTVASSGVASLLLPNGRTAHSRFRIPIDVDELSMCDIKRGTKLADLIAITDLIIWDEA